MTESYGFYTLIILSAIISVIVTIYYFQKDRIKNEHRTTQIEYILCLFFCSFISVLMVECLIIVILMDYTMFSEKMMTFFNLK